LASESTYFQEYGDYIKELTLKSGQKVTYKTVPLSNSGDYRDIATKYSRSDCDAVYSWIPMGSAGVFFRRLRENGYKGLILSIVETDDPGVLKSAGASAEGVVFARLALGSNDFVQSYKQKYNEMPSRPAIPSYDGVRLLLELIEQVGTDPDALKSSFIKVKNKSATNGVMTYTEEGERLGENIELMMIRNGEAKRIN
jgi:ABC-type branched-subunit amino acid transport system substrate-binding protein